MKSVYWLGKQEIPHTTNYVPLLNLAKSFGCELVQHLIVGRNGTYTSERIGQEFLLLLAHQIEVDQLCEVSASPFISFMTDKTTDVAVLKELVLYARYLSADGKVKSIYLNIQDLFNGTAEKSMKLY